MVRADGRVKPIITSGSLRDSLLPNVPTERQGEDLKSEAAKWPKFLHQAGIRAQ